VFKFWKKTEGDVASGREPRGGQFPKLILHVGPHKTGTTSLQRALLKEHGSEKPQETWYPIPARPGPGHAVIAWETLGRRGREPMPAIKQLIEEAGRANCKQLVLSSEEFSGSYRSGIEYLVEQTSEVDLHIVVTLSPIGRRVISTWQERVKHGFRNALKDANEAVLRGPGVAPDFTGFFATHFPSTPISVLIVDQATPSDLYKSFSEATGVPLPAPAEPEDRMRNPSLGLVEAEVLRGFNIATAAADISDEGRKMLMTLFKTEEWRAVVPTIPLTLPKEWIASLSGRSEETIRQLRDLASCGRIQIFGDLDRLNDLAEGGNKDVDQDDQARAGGSIDSVLAR
jgi:hypothetical protein